MAKRKRLTHEEFVTAWAKAKSLDDVVAATGMSRVGVQARASRLRKAGVRLRRFARAKQPIDVKGLNALLARLGAKGNGRRKKTK
jgi:hypothetical protein